MTQKETQNNKESWQEKFRQEFGIRFKNSLDELVFAIYFIEDLLSIARKEWEEKERERFVLALRQLKQWIHEKSVLERGVRVPDIDEKIDEIISALSELKGIK